MPLISDTNQKKLEKLNINIKTKYIVNKNILERNTDNSKNDNIKDGNKLMVAKVFASNSLSDSEKMEVYREE